MEDVKMANITSLASIAARKTLCLRKLDFHIVKKTRIKIYAKDAATLKRGSHFGAETISVRIRLAQHQVY